MSSTAPECDVIATSTADRRHSSQGRNWAICVLQLDARASSHARIFADDARFTIRSVRPGCMAVDSRRTLTRVGGLTETYRNR